MIEEGQFFLLLLRVFLDLAFLAPNLRLVDFAFAFGCQEGARSHRKGAGQHARQTTDEHQVAGRASCIARYTADDAEDCAQSIIRAVDGITQPASAALVPAFAPQHDVEHTLRANGADDLANDAPMTLFLAPHFAQHGLSFDIVDAAGLRLVTRNVFIFFALKLAQGGIGSQLAAQPALKTHL